MVKENSAGEDARERASACARVRMHVSEDGGGRCVGCALESYMCVFEHVGCA